MNPDNKLAPCPFCGSKAFLFENHESNSRWEVHCKRCFGKVTSMNSVEQAIHFWNRRENEKPSQEKIAALSKEEFDRWAAEAIQKTIAKLRKEKEEEVIEWQA